MESGRRDGCNIILLSRHLRTFVHIRSHHVCQRVRAHLEQMSLCADVAVSIFKRIGCLHSVQVRFQRQLPQRQLHRQLALSELSTTTLGCREQLCAPTVPRTHTACDLPKKRAWVDSGVRSVVAKDTMSAMVKLAREVEDSSSDVLVYGMVTLPMASSRNQMWRAMLSFLSLSRPTECGMQVDGVCESIGTPTVLL